MNYKNNRRFWAEDKYHAEPNMKLGELKQILKNEKREDNSQVIKEVIFNRLFARTVFIICILLNLVFVTLGILDYF
ncbi:MAG: hypothetical protein GY793_00325 [Proteobacteria bacterium]|nr:hypothetical protein [Pseudomonadota bacterium]